MAEGGAGHRRREWWWGLRLYYMHIYGVESKKFSRQLIHPYIHRGKLRAYPHTDF